MHLPTFNPRPLVESLSGLEIANHNLNSHIKEKTSQPGPSSDPNLQEHDSQAAMCIRPLGCGIWLSLFSLQFSF